MSYSLIRIVHFVSSAVSDVAASRFHIFVRRSLMPIKGVKSRTPRPHELCGHKPSGV
jgi:hypothetical protein